jgi:hypothetical protein
MLIGTGPPIRSLNAPKSTGSAEQSTGSAEMSVLLSAYL